MTTSLRPELDPLTPRLQRLAVDDRGYPIPWFVPYVDGRPEFRGMDGAKLARAVREKRCWICGDFLGVHLTFSIGPMCAVNRNIAEPPSHYDCAQWSVLNCPFLTRPHMTRREDEFINAAKFEEHAAGIAILRNPGVIALWRTKTFRVVPDPGRGPLFTIGDPSAVEWYTQRRRATRAEVQAAIAAGLPQLQAQADQEPSPARRSAARQLLADLVRNVDPYLPPEA